MLHPRCGLWAVWAVWATGYWGGWVDSYTFGPVGELPYVVSGGILECFHGQCFLFVIAKSLEEIVAADDVGLYVLVELASGALEGLVEASGICDSFSGLSEVLVPPWLGVGRWSFFLGCEGEGVLEDLGQCLSVFI